MTAVPSDKVQERATTANFSRRETPTTKATRGLCRGDTTHQLAPLPAPRSRHFLIDIITAMENIPANGCLPACLPAISSKTNAIE